MADEPKEKKSLLSKLGAATKAATKLMLAEVDVTASKLGNASTFDADYVGIEMIMGNADRPARSRSEIYLKWHHMVQDGLISTILRLHVQMALGGHETTGETIFIEPKADITPADAKIVEDLALVAALLNKSAHGTCFNGVTFGDSYARIRVMKGVGLVQLDAESLFPPLVQAYEEGGRTVGFVVSLGPKMQTRFNHLQVVRMKMPRMVFLPQMRAIENAQKMNLESEDPRDLTPLPALVGGSFLEAMEEDYDNLIAALRGMIGQRIAGSIDETMIGANMSDMTLEQQESFMRSLEKMLKSMKERAEQAVKSGVYATSRNYHIMPTFNEKQLTQISSFQGASAGAGANIEDVMFCARKLAGTGGIDLSMVGFADQLTGGLGEGGFNRTSSQAAERSRIIRTAYTTFVNDVIDRHMLAKYGWCWDDSERPYNVNFFGSIAALEAEKQASRERSMNTVAILVQILAGMRDLGVDEKTIKQLLLMAELDQEQVTVVARGIKNAKPPQQDMGGGVIMGPDGQPVETSEPEQALTNDNDDEAA